MQIDTPTWRIRGCWSWWPPKTPSSTTRRTKLQGGYYTLQRAFDEEPQVWLDGREGVEVPKADQNYAWPQHTGTVYIGPQDSSSDKHTRGNKCHSIPGEGEEVNASGPHQQYPQWAEEKVGQPDQLGGPGAHLWDKHLQALLSRKSILYLCRLKASSPPVQSQE